ncbi:MAG: Ribosomal protein S23 [Bacteroidetes bacterium]|nr:MAG: Ribosomal protein S23 [Bacteroidota bacterium]
MEVSKFDFKQMTVYKKAFEVSMEIFRITKKFPDDEKYGLTTQIRRSSRSVCANLAEAYRKRIYKAHFISKVSDCDMENSEIQVWLDFAYACEYISQKQYHDLMRKSEETGRLLNHMIENPEKYKRSINSNDKTK